MPSPAPGYLACLDAVPPLIFPFQFNPDLLSDKKSFKYSAANRFGEWKFDRTAAATGFFGGVAGLLSDLKEWGSLLTATKPLEPQEGEPRQIGIEFVLDATLAGPYDLTSESPRNIKADLAVLRSFVYPGWELLTVIPELITSGTFPCWNRPPACSFSYGGISMTGVMTDLDIKLTAFNEDGDPLRAEVSVTLKEQTYSIGTVVDTVSRFYQVTQSYSGPHVVGFAKDWGNAFIAPFISAFG